MERKIRVVADSSADLLELPGVDFVSVPLHVVAGPNDWVDDEHLDVNAMLDTLATYRGRSGSSCPAPEDWIHAFGDAGEIFCVPISCNMSGSYNSASIAARDYMETYPGRRVHVIDTLLASAPMALVCEYLHKFITAGDDFDTIVEKIDAETRRTRLLFCLQSVRSLANNGRLSQAVATLVGMLNIRMIARASVKGEAEMLSKARGDKKAVVAITEWLKEMGYNGKRLLIHHCRNLGFAEAIRNAVLAIWPEADIQLDLTRGLCSYYAEDGGLLIGFQVD